MNDNQSLPLNRQKELVVINKVLAVSVVILAALLGLFLVRQNHWLKQSNVPMISEPLQATTDTPYSIIPATSSAFVNLAAKSRWHRSITEESLSKEQLIRLLWIAQGKITEWGERTVPSYKASYPVELLVYVRSVTGMNPGLYIFDAKRQVLVPSRVIGSITFPSQQPGSLTAPVVLFAYTRQYQDQMAFVESGAISQEILLGATEMNLVTYIISPDNLPDDSLKSLSIRAKELLWIMPIGYLNPAANQ